MRQTPLGKSDEKRIEKAVKKTDSLIKSVSYSQTEILRNILTLHVPGGVIDCDPTYSTGGFYRDGTIPPPRLRVIVNIKVIQSLV